MRRNRKIAHTSQVPIHARHHAALLNPNPIECASACDLVIAVSTAPIHLPYVLRIEVAYCDCASTIVLQDFVVGVAGSSTVDIGGARALLEGGGIFADVGPPDVIEGAGAYKR